MLELNYVVTKSNKLVQADYKDALTLREQKVILYLISKIRLEDTELKEYTLSIKRFGELMGYSGTPQYSEVRAAIKGLMRKLVEIEEEGANVISHWISNATTVKRDGTITLTFDSKLQPYLIQIKNSFTNYPLKSVLSLNSVNSIRIYELLQLWEFRREHTVELLELRNLLGLKDQYKEYSNFKHRVLKKAYDEINDKTDIRFEYEEILEVKKVVALKFIIKPNRKKREVVDNEFTESITRIFEKNNLTIDKVVLNRWFKLAKKIWVEDEEILKNTYTNVEIVLNSKSYRNPIAFITYFLNKKVECIKEGRDHNEVSLDVRKENLPEWFQKYKDERDGITPEQEVLSDEMILLREELLKSLGVGDKPKEEVEV